MNKTDIVCYIECLGDSNLKGFEFIGDYFKKLIIRLTSLRGIKKIGVQQQIAIYVCRY